MKTRNIARFNSLDYYLYSGMRSLIHRFGRPTQNPLSDNWGIKFFSQLRDENYLSSFKRGPGQGLSYTGLAKPSDSPSLLQILMFWLGLNSLPLLRWWWNRLNLELTKNFHAPVFMDAVFCGLSKSSKKQFFTEIRSSTYFSYLFLSKALSQAFYAKVQEFNNARHNTSLMRYIEIFIIYPLCVTLAVAILFIGNYINKNHSKQGIVYTKVVNNIIFGIIVPLYILFKRKRIRRYMKNISCFGWST